MHPDLFAFANTKFDAIKGGKRLRGKLDPFWTLQRSIQINLGDLIAAQRADVFDPHRDIQSTVRGFDHLQIRIVKTAVGQTVAKREKRLGLLLVEPTIANINSFGEGGLAVNSFSRTLRISGICRRVIFKLFSPRKRKATSRIHFSEQNICGRPASLVSWPPHLEYGLYFAEPRHGDRLTHVEDHDRIRIHRCDLLNEFVLLAW